MYNPPYLKRPESANQEVPKADQLLLRVWIGAVRIFNVTDNEYGSLFVVISGKYSKIDCHDGGTTLCFRNHLIVCLDG